jgi:hypothetical protein
MATIRLDPPLPERRKSDRVQRVPDETAIRDLTSSALRNAIRHHIATGGNVKDFVVTLVQPTSTYDPYDAAQVAEGLVRVTIQVIAMSSYDPISEAK